MRLYRTPERLDRLPVFNVAFHVRLKNDTHGSIPFPHRNVNHIRKMHTHPKRIERQMTHFRYKNYLMFSILQRTSFLYKLNPYIAGKPYVLYTLIPYIASDFVACSRNKLDGLFVFCCMQS